mgnify:FL=1
MNNGRIAYICGQEKRKSFSLLNYSFLIVNY